MGFAEDVGMAAQEFGVDRSEHVGDGEGPLVRADLGMEPHLEQDVAELLRQVAAVAFVDGVDGLVALLDDVAP